LIYNKLITIANGNKKYLKPNIFKWINNFISNLSVFAEVDFYIRDNKENDKVNAIIYKTDYNFSFVDIVNPNLALNLMENFISLSEKYKINLNNNNSKELNYIVVLINYLTAFSKIGYEFSLDKLFSQFLNLFDIVEFKGAKKRLDEIKYFFEKISHEFYLLGLFTRKSTTNLTFYKNYFSTYNI
jgi:hypothetical protein